MFIRNPRLRTSQRACIRAPLKKQWQYQGLSSFIGFGVWVTVDDPRLVDFPKGLAHLQSNPDTRIVRQVPVQELLESHAPAKGHEQSWDVQAISEYKRTPARAVQPYHELEFSTERVGKVLRHSYLKGTRLAHVHDEEKTYKGIETRLKDWQALREAEKKLISQLRSQEEELRKKTEKQGEDQQKTEKQGEDQQKTEQQGEDQQKTEQQGEDQQKTEQQGEDQQKTEQQGEDQQKTEQQGEDQQKTEQQGEDQQKTEQQEQYRELKSHMEEFYRRLEREHSEHVEADELQQRIKESQAKWREQFLKEQMEVKGETQNKVFGCEDSAFESRIKRLKDRYEHDLSVLEVSEREARTSYLEMKSILSQKDEEIVYLRARLHSQDLEMCELHNTIYEKQ
ncbi:probable serine/threonine-protein kinase irlF [Penaeus japonicus]|uniref:probable serine/threonine-protein kinase irlF n=1 Tax=Penaeus japonicus TaxID=27405 RepID=UPI001C715E8A|nr:probable serine/threonine-protein kinase irlF [Penaeus japonicus]